MILNFVTERAGDLFLPVIATAAAIDSLNPCAFSILFLTIAFLFSLGKDRKFVLLAGGSYIFGIALVYTLIGVGLLEALSVFNVPNVMAKVGAMILIAYSAIGIINELLPAFPIKLSMPKSGHAVMARYIHKASMPASLLLGVIVGLFEFPCTGGPYLFVLSLLHDQATYWQGFGYLLVYNFIFVLPLIIILAVSTNRAVLERVDALRKVETKKYRILLMLILALMGALILFI